MAELINRHVDERERLQIPLPLVHKWQIVSEIDGHGNKLRSLTVRESLLDLIMQ
ncbi:predicted protein [Sclerotinia sclerotiorum 1980 UF-70]|uniref:Uncharacterized protein n=1 Tax=Sclerotinia sclerotiorum (strain ATCC 18683 / 1980 / Ss-1) TaxID=665079 RepID=A7EQU3_SCLS1|nr:predicted protein [Sclerotinia sclerotiorum 1980 UF-70]EDN91835.1 predicted protein [Sclerotinia sclerotiorum 1980 UF-70]